MRKYCFVENGIARPEVEYPVNVKHPELYTRQDMENLGYYPFEYPLIDQRFQVYSDPAWDAETKTVVFGVEVITLTVSEAQQRRIMEIRNRAKVLLSQTDWYYIRFTETGDFIPAPVGNERAAIRAQCNVEENQIMALTDIVKILTFDSSL